MPFCGSISGRICGGAIAAAEALKLMPLRQRNTAETASALQVDLIDHVNPERRGID
jgi:hypothetical protein